MTVDTELAERIAQLPPEQRARLFEQLREKKMSRPAAEARRAIPRQPRDAESYELSFAQERLWFLNQFEPESAEYNVPQSYRLEGELDPARMRRALRALVARHETLRTTFREVDGEARQIIAVEARVELPVLDLRDSDGDDRALELALQDATGDARVPFDLARGPLLRARLYRLADRRHLLYLNVHHIAFDGWSQDIMIRELLALYRAGGTGAPALDELPIQYLDYALWQRRVLAGERLKEQVEFWGQRFASTPVLDLATDRPRPAVRTHEGSIVPVALSEQLTRDLEELGRGEGATLFMTVMAAWRTLLYRTSQQSDFAIGTLIANRTRPELEGLIGFFTNTLALRLDVSAVAGFRDLLRLERSATLEAYDHQDLPFEKLVEELNPERDLSRTPYFQVMLLLQNAPRRTSAVEVPDESDLEVSLEGVDSHTAKFDLTLYLVQGARLTGFLEYNSDLFERGSAERLVEHLNVLLEAVVADPDRALDEIPLLAADERQRLLVDWNSTRAEAPRGGVVQMFERQVAADPERPALVADDESLTYGELDRRANRLARHLRRLGVGPEDFVGVCTDRSSALPVALLGVLKAGGAYLPLDPEYPRERLAFLLADTAAPVLLTQKPLVEKLPEHGAETVLLDEDSGSWHDLDDAALPDPAPSSGLAYVIHTSGSTGKPKGVLVSHGALANFLTTMARRPGLTRDDTLLAVTTLSFDIAGLELYLPLTMGARLVLASREVAGDGERLAAKIADSGVTAMQATPATWRLLLGAGWRGDPELAVLCGGEALPGDLASELLGKCRVLWNVYGPTETTIWSAARRVEASDAKAATVTLGQPIGNTRIYLVDRRFEPVPVGIPGELLIGGRGLARGYLRRGGLTADRFVPDPFTATESGGRLYRTGDLVRYRADGNLLFLGRLDHQVKVRGFRIELGEIEAALGQHEGIAQAVVIVREDRPGDRRLVAYLVAAGKDLPKTAELREALKKSLPEYMVPALFVPVEAMPLTPNGKVDRKALPKPDPSLLRSDTEYVAPRDETEEALAAIWSEVLAVPRIGIDDNFFELGGDSLLVIRVVSKAKKVDLGITTRQLFQNPTVAQLAGQVGTTEILAEQGPVVGEISMTPAQIHFLGLGHTEPQLHSLGAMLEPREGGIDRAAVDGALAAVLRQHDTLRMRLERRDGGSVLIGAPPPETAGARTYDLSHLEGDEQKEAARERATELIYSFELDGGVLLRAGLFEYGDAKPPMLFLIGHFLVADIGSWQTILDDFDRAYASLSKGEEPALGEKTTSFKQWVERLDEHANGKDMVPEHDYWLKEERRESARMPLDRPEGANVMSSSKSVPLELTEAETEAMLRTVPRATGAQIDAILLASVLYGFEHWTGSRALLIDLLGHGREPLWDDIDLTRTVGWLNTIFPAFLTLGETEDPVSAVKLVNRQLRDIPNGGIGYGLLRYLNRDPGIAGRFERQPEPQVFFNYFGPDNAAELTTLKKVEGFGGYGFDQETRRLRPLAIGVYVQDEKMLIRWEYSTNVHEHETIEKVAEHSLGMLRELIARVGESTS
ncbi:MAG: amino acid adenylation domain-containing protein [bacterium]|nr:amino acid adenylation domain-containing protein [bacterium]